MQKKYDCTFEEIVQILETSYTKPLSKKVYNTLMLAYTAHMKQYRAAHKNEEKPSYIIHPVNTALLCIKYYNVVPYICDELDTAICVALLHDTLEDTLTPRDFINEIAGKQVLHYVDALTRQRVGEEQADITVYMDTVKAAGSTALYVKMCDCIDNLSFPDKTPDNLLQKIVDKVKDHYILYMFREKVNNTVLDELKQTLYEAQTVLFHAPYRDGKL